MVKLDERQATVLFNILDELKEVEDMEWARLGNFEDFTVEEFKDMLVPLLNVLEVPEQEVRSQTSITIEQLENIIDGLKVERADLVEAYADACIGDTKLIQELDRINVIIYSVFDIIDDLEKHEAPPVIKDIYSSTSMVDLTEDDVVALANLLITLNENMPGLRCLVDHVGEDMTVGEVLESLLPSLESVVEQLMG